MKKYLFIVILCCVSFSLFAQEQKNVYYKKLTQILSLNINPVPGESYQLVILPIGNNKTINGIYKEALINNHDKSVFYVLTDFDYFEYLRLLLSLSDGMIQNIIPDVYGFLYPNHTINDNQVVFLKVNVSHSGVITYKEASI